MKLLVPVVFAVILMLIAFIALSINLFFKREPRLRGCSTKEGGCCNNSCEV